MHTIDTHSHFNLPQFDSDRVESIERMLAAGVGTITIGIDYKTSVLAVELTDKYENLWAIVGIHPTEWAEQFDAELFEKLVDNKKVVGVGECGLDYFRELEREHIVEQKQLFHAHIRFALAHDLPLMLHIRPEAGTQTAYEEALDILEEYKKTNPNLRGTAHFFVGSIAIAKRFLDLGFHISFSGVITIFPEYEEVVKFVPIDRILSETDAPFAAPKPYRGKRNSPEYVVEVVKKVSELKGIPLEDTSVQLLQNARNLFNI